MTAFNEFVKGIIEGELAVMLVMLTWALTVYIKGNNQNRRGISRHVGHAHVGLNGLHQRK